MKIASLEDDLDQARRIQQVLTAAGYTCSSYQQSRDLLSAMRNESFDLVLLDWHLPDIDGDDVVRWLRANIGPRIPVIFLTNRSSEDDLVEGLRAGADDYIVKPLRPLELLARVAALLRRSQIAEPADESFDVANYRVEPSARTIALNGKAVTLAPKEFELALLFFRNLGRLMSRDVLAECVWNRKFRPPRARWTRTCPTSGKAAAAAGTRRAPDLVLCAGLPPGADQRPGRRPARAVNAPAHATSGESPAMRRHRALASLVLFSSLLLGAVAHGQPAGSLGEDFIYRVRAGDTLINIANTYTRNSANWNPLQSLNKIVAPEQLPIGLELHIPLSMIPVRPAEARVVHVSGQASAAGKTLAPGASLPEGSTIVTAPNGFVTLELADGSKLTLPADGSVELSRMRQFEGTGLTDSVVRVQRGSVESSVAPEGQGVGRFEIRTPVAVTGVRGTRFRVQSGSGGVHSEVLEGSVRLQPHAPAPRRPSPWPWPAASARRSADGTVAGLRQLLPAPQLAAPARRRSMDQRVRAGARRQELSGARIARRRWRAARVFRAFRQQRHPFSRPGAAPMSRCARSTIWACTDRTPSPPSKA